MPGTSAERPHQDLESVLVTGELDRRPSRLPDHERERASLLELTRDLARWPREFFTKLVKYVLKLSHEGRFVWPAVAGKLENYLGAGTPGDFGPCGTVLER